MNKIARFFYRGSHFVLGRLSRLDEKLERKLQASSAKKEMQNICDLAGRQMPDPFFEKIRLITHAGGGLQGMAYLNCADAPARYYGWGNRTFELDVQESADGKFVLSHDPVEQTEEDFLQTRIDGRFAPMKLDALLDFTKGHPDVTVIFDCKVGHLGDFARYLKENLEGSDALDRVVIQVFREQDILDIREVYAFKMLHVCMYEADYCAVAERCLRYDIGAVSVSHKAVCERKGWELFSEKNICIFAYTVNTLGQLTDLRNKQITGVFSDYLLESDLV